MNEWDARAKEWDADKVHMDRSLAVAQELEKIIPAEGLQRALEYGAGTGILSFLLKDRFQEIVLMDSSREMIRVCEEKAGYLGTPHVKPLWFDLEHNDFDGKFDMIYNQMVLHHVNDFEKILTKFSLMLNQGGLLAIADLYAEDGSFHGPDVKVHHGFNPDKLIESLQVKGFNHAEHKICFEIERPNGLKYPVFLLTATKM